MWRAFDFITGSKTLCFSFFTRSYDLAPYNFIFYKLQDGLSLFCYRSFSSSSNLSLSNFSFFLTSFFSCSLQNYSIFLMFLARLDNSCDPLLCNGVMDLFSFGRGSYKSEFLSPWFPGVNPLEVEFVLTCPYLGCLLLFLSSFDYSKDRRVFYTAELRALSLADNTFASLEEIFYLCSGFS